MKQEFASAAFLEPKAKKTDSLWRKIVEHRWCYVFLIPMLIMFSAFTIYPIIMSGYYAFFDWNGIGWPEKFVGFANFKELVKDKLFWNAFKNTYVFALAQTAVKLPIALFLAILLNNRKLRSASAYRTLFFLPVVTTTAIIGIIFTFILNPYNGALNNILKGIGLINQPLDWLGVGDLAFLMVVVVGSWQRIGQYMVYWLAGLQSVPEELYEAAKVDGANSLQVFRNITFPLLKPIAAVILIFGIVHALRVFDLVMTMTGGGPNYATDMMGTYVYRTAFSSESGIPRMSYASAAGLIFGLSLVVVAILQSGVTKKIRDIRQGQGV
ncbi:MAG: carbohydrate ABC transporter permease [Bacteroidota bacterium]